ncbi:glutaredoxin-like domain-containing protein [Colletotrichum lupini]|uniref:Glutaredoxin-like domain-containing protein n=1 Tax=Colletotrichum lupini TaxID=145971 RepID=A0A9Q8WDP0_9PEZI|nr:glutaredoxin-like domain-containing protein [Colletotrichum lupini]UQC79928.1 glutaredoxin-like domain-containing protein [Colletotrichum lupini]
MTGYIRPCPCRFRVATRPGWKFSRKLQTYDPKKTRHLQPTLLPFFAHFIIITRRTGTSSNFAFFVADPTIQSIGLFRNDNQRAFLSTPSQLADIGRHISNTTTDIVRPSHSTPTPTYPDPWYQSSYLTFLSFLSSPRLPFPADRERGCFTAFEPPSFSRFKTIIKMFAPTRRLFQKVQPCRITLFSRDECGLCVRAKSALSNVWDRRPFAYTEVVITKPENKKWRDLYDFDVPVFTAKIHISKAEAPEEDVKLVGKAVKLMHRFDPDQIEAKMDQVEGEK